MTSVSFFYVSRVSIKCYPTWRGQLRIEILDGFDFYKLDHVFTGSTLINVLE